MLAPVTTFLSLKALLIDILPTLNEGDSYHRGYAAISVGSCCPLLRSSLDRRSGRIPPSPETFPFLAAELGIRAVLFGVFGQLWETCGGAWLRLGAREAFGASGYVHAEAQYVDGADQVGILREAALDTSKLRSHIAVLLRDVTTSRTSNAGPWWWNRDELAARADHLILQLPAELCPSPVQDRRVESGFLLNVSTSSSKCRGKSAPCQIFPE
jgi:hypothetical protein